MPIIYNKFTLILLTFLFIGCGAKQITVKSLYPSKIPSEKIHTIAIEKFSDDYIYQTEQIESSLKNKTIEGKKVFNLNTSLQNADVLIRGDVNSDLFYTIYYKEHTDYSRCRRYRYEDGKKKKRCLEYYIRLTPCENTEYVVSTKIDVLKQRTNEIIFTKEYTKKKNLSQCFDNYYYPYHSYPRNKTEINNKLASLIAKEFLDDISPHYVYYDVDIIEELNKDDLNFTKKQSTKFEKIVELIQKKNLNLAKEELLKLDGEFNSKSFEVLYNLGLVYEASAKLYEANIFYEKSKKLVKDIDTLAFINNSIKRVNINLEEKIRAKSQLP